MGLDGNACLTAGKCLIITNNQYYIFIAIFYIAAILILILVLVGFMTPAIVFLKAKFTRGSLIYTVNRGQMGQFLIAKTKFQGIADVPKVGPFIITENSHTIELKSKTPFYFAFGEFAATLPLEYATIVEQLREKGTKITNIEDLAKLVGLEFDDTKKTWKATKEGALKDKDGYALSEQITPYKTIQLHNLAYMFPFNITPALVESKIQHMIGLKQAMFNKLTPQTVIMFVMVLMGAALAAMIVSKFVMTGDASVIETQTVIERIVEATPAQELMG